MNAATEWARTNGAARLDLLTAHDSLVRQLKNFGRHHRLQTMILLPSVFLVIRLEYEEEAPAGCSKPVMTGFWLPYASRGIFLATRGQSGAGGLVVADHPDRLRA